MQTTNKINTERPDEITQAIKDLSFFKTELIKKAVKKGRKKTPQIPIRILPGEIKAIETVLNYVATLERKINEMDRWIHVEKRLPDDEAENFIQEEVNGVGYLYPCLLAYRSPHTERIHVVRFYYDIHEKWFVNAGEKLCEKDRCIAWQPLPELPKEGKTDAKVLQCYNFNFFVASLVACEIPLQLLDETIVRLRCYNL